MSFEKNKIRGTLGTALALAIIAGALSGVTASVLTNKSISNYIESLNEGSALLKLSEVKPRPIPGTYEEALERVEESGFKSLATLIKASDNSAFARDWIDVYDAAGYGAVITSDGWILFHQDAFQQFRDPVEYAEVWISGKRYEISEIKYDSLTDFALVRVDGDNLPALAFGSANEYSGGELLFEIGSDADILSTSLLSGSLLEQEHVLPAETFFTTWQTADSYGKSVPILNSSGELVGIADGDGNAVPLNHGLSFVQSVLRTGEVEHAAIGAYVTDIGKILNIDEELKGSANAGALVVSPNSWTDAVVEGSPADLAGIKSGDVIISVGDTVIANSSTLAEVISLYGVGTDAVFKILRGAEVIDLTVVFADLEDVVY